MWKEKNKSIWFWDTLIISHTMEKSLFSKKTNKKRFTKTLFSKTKKKKKKKRNKKRKNKCFALNGLILLYSRAKLKQIHFKATKIGPLLACFHSFLECHALNPRAQFCLRTVLKYDPFFKVSYFIIYPLGAPNFQIKVNVFLLNKRRSVLCTHLDSASTKGIFFQSSSFCSASAKRNLKLKGSD